MKKHGFISVQKSIEPLDLKSPEPRLLEFFLNSRQIEAIAHLAQSGSLTSLQYRERFGVSSDVAISELLQLAEEGIVREEGKLKFVKV